MRDERRVERRCVCVGEMCEGGCIVWPAHISWCCARDVLRGRRDGRARVPRGHWPEGAPARRGREPPSPSLGQRHRRGGCRCGTSARCSPSSVPCRSSGPRAGLRVRCRPHRLAALRQLLRAAQGGSWRIAGRAPATPRACAPSSRPSTPCLRVQTASRDSTPTDVPRTIRPSSAACGPTSTSSISGSDSASRRP